MNEAPHKRHLSPPAATPSRRVTWRRTRRRATGFTLVELMVVMVASAIVVAGAFALHHSFARQNQRMQKVAEVQQTLRVARQFLERKLRKSGAGLNGKTFELPMDTGTGCQPKTIGGIIVHNLNDWAPPIFDSGNEAQVDPDPDWFEFAYMDINDSPATLSGKNASPSMVADVGNVEMLRGIEPCSGYVNFGKPGQTPCIYAISEIQFDSAKIKFDGTKCTGACAGYSPYSKLCDCICADGLLCKDFPNNLDYVKFSQQNGCLPTACCELYTKGMPISTMGPGIAALRLYETGLGDTAFTYPFNVFAYGSLDGATAAYKWEPLAELIEDIQYEVFLSDGQITGTKGNRRDLIAPPDPNAEWHKMRAIRYTILAKSRTPVANEFSQTLAAYADRPACPRSGGTAGCPYNDGHIRRIVQGVVQLRNYGL